MRRLFLVTFLIAIQLPVLAQETVPSSMTVLADMDPSYLDQVEVSVLCSTGSLQEQRFTFGPGESRVVSPVSYAEGRTFCQVKASPPVGYSVSYSVAGPGKYIADRNGCQFSPLATGTDNRCTIQITQDAVTLTVYKEWIGGSGKDEGVRVSLECESGEWSSQPLYINEGEPGSWAISNIEPEGILCNVSEEVRDTFRPDIIDCQGLFILPGKGEECTMVNTRIVKRIEMLNRYGKIIMIILVLAVGLIAARRLA